MTVCFYYYSSSLLLCITSLKIVHEPPPDCSRSESGVFALCEWERVRRRHWHQMIALPPSSLTEQIKTYAKSTAGTELCRTDRVVWISIVDGQPVLPPEDVGLRMSKRRATVEDSPLPLGHLNITWLQAELLLKGCNNSEGTLKKGLEAEVGTKLYAMFSMPCSLCLICVLPIEWCAAVAFAF